jgi:hypothetical protein
VVCDNNYKSRWGFFEGAKEYLMFRRSTLVLSLGLSLLTAGFLAADTLRLRSGDIIDGTFLGGDTRQVRFIGPDGNVKTYSVGDIETISFVAPAAVAAPAPAPAPARVAPPPAPAPVRAATTSSSPRVSAASVTIPAGTVISIRMIDSIDSDVTDAGERFRASIDDPVSVGGAVVIPRNADATVQVARVEQSGAITGSDEVALKLFNITVDGRAYELATNYAEVKSEGKGASTAKTTAVTTGIGAIVGGIIGGGKGAAIGAGAGAGTGVAVSAARGKKLSIPSESRLDFVLRAPLTID